MKNSKFLLCKVVKCIDFKTKKVNCISLNIKINNKNKKINKIKTLLVHDVRGFSKKGDFVLIKKSKKKSKLKYYTIEYTI